MEKIIKTSMEMFNKRADVEWYEIGVFTKDFKSIPFVSQYKIIKIPYLTKVKFDVYIDSKNKKRAVYICSMSKLVSDKKNQALVASKICSKFK